MATISAAGALSYTNPTAFTHSHVESCILLGIFWRSSHVTPAIPKKQQQGAFVIYRSPLVRQWAEVLEAPKGPAGAGFQRIEACLGRANKVRLWNLEAEAGAFNGLAVLALELQSLDMLR